MPFLERPEARVHYAVRHPESGLGRWVTLLTGHGRSGKDFGAFTRTLVERGFSVLAIDNRGAGQSVATAAFTLEDIADDVVAVWDAEHVAESAVFGISMGGMVAQTLATSPAANRITALVLVSTAPAAKDISNADQVPGAPSTRTPEERFGRYFAPAFTTKHRTLFTAFVKEMARGFSTEEAQRGSERQRAAMRGFDRTARLGAIRIPTLVVHGTEDRIAPPEAAEKLARGIPGAKLVWIRDAGHLLLAEQPRALYDRATEFLLRGIE